MATVSNCVICGKPTKYCESGHVHFKTKNGRDKILFARFCCDEYNNVGAENARKLRGTTKICNFGCYGGWKKEDGLRGLFRRNPTGYDNGPAYLAIEELDK